MSWLNLNQSLNSLKGQITNFASEVLSEVPAQDPDSSVVEKDSLLVELEAKCRNQELEIASLKKLTDELQASLQSERLSRKNGVKDEESSWYWDPPPQQSKSADMENQYEVHIRSLQDEISSMKERSTIEMRPDTEEELNRLREENQNLTSSLEELDNQHQMAMERLLSLKKELQKNFEVLKQEHEELKNTNEEYAIEVQELLNKIGERDKEIENLKAVKSDFDTLQHKHQNLERIYGLLRENAEKFQEENQDLHEEVFKLQEQVTKLEHEMEIITKQSELSNVVPKDRYEDLLKELNDLKGRRNSNRMDLDEINIDDNAKSVIENLKREINELKHKLENAESGDNKLVKSEKVMQLYNKYVNFELPVDYVGEIPSAGDNIVLYKLENVFKAINSFKKEIDSLKQELSEKNLNINNLQTQIDDLTTENGFLTTDLQHFERELSESKKNNDFLISEIVALKNTSKLQPIIESHEDNLVKLETELADSNRMNKNFESEIKKIQKELSEVSSEKVELQKSLQDLKEKYTSMLAELEECKNQTQAIEELEENANSQIYHELKNTSDEIGDLKKRLNAANAKNEQLSIDIHIIENDKVLLTKEVDDLRTALNEKSSEHKDLEVLKVALDQKLHDLEVKLDEVIKHKVEVENEKLTLEERVVMLSNELSSKNNYSQEEFGRNETERLKLLEKLERLTKENNTLLESKENATILQQTVDQLKGKLVQQEILNAEIFTLKEENKKILEKKLELEAELSSTDSKIVHLEDEFDKLIADLNEKDSIIDALNSTITKNNKNLQTMNQNIVDLENSIAVKNDEIKQLRESFQELTISFNDTSHKSNVSQEELKRLQVEKEDLSKQLIHLNDEMNSKNDIISNLSSNIQEKEKMCQEYKNTIESKDKDIEELKQSILQLTDKLKNVDNTSHQNDEYAKLVQEKEVIEKEINAHKQNVTLKENELTRYKEKLKEVEQTCLEYKVLLENIHTEKNELINLVTMKHNESIQYHNEIQRLNQVIVEQANEFKHIIEEKDKMSQNCNENCSHCETIKVSLKEKDEIIMNLNKNLSDTVENAKMIQLEASQTIQNLTEERDRLSLSLALQLETVKKLRAEILQLSEQEQNSSRELERLRDHLVQMEENYTQELMESEQKLTECQTRLNQVEERAKQTSTLYTSNSIRANQEVETLRNQIKLLEKQREDVQAKLSEAEDAKSRNEAAVTNLQVVLEQFQLDKERDIEAATEKIRNKMDDLRRENKGLQDEIMRLNQKLEESLASLQAASRLGDQVETKTALINDLKEQVRTLQISVSAAEERYHNAISNQQDRVDKNLVKNLVMNYVLAAAQSVQNRTRILKILSTVLDFNQQECERLGLARSSNSSDGIAAEFVKFLESESRPRAALPNMMGIAQNTSRSNTPPSRKSSTLGPNPFEVGHRRNPSTGSNNLLFQNIENMETSSQISIESDHREPRVANQLDTGVNQTRNTEGAILKHVLKDM